MHSSFKQKEDQFSRGETTASERRAVGEQAEWLKIIGNSVYGGFAEFIHSTRFAFPSLHDVYANWDHVVAYLGNDSKALGELFEIYCFAVAKAQLGPISTNWLNATFMPKYRFSGDELGLDDLYKAKFELFSDLRRTCGAEQAIANLNKFNAKYLVDGGFVSTPPVTIDHMLAMLDIRPGTVVIDPCCGRGTILLWLKQKYGAEIPIYGIEKDVGKAYLAAALLEPNVPTANNIFVRDSLTIRDYDKEIIRVPRRGLTMALSDVTDQRDEPTRIVTITNPPFQKVDGGYGSSATPLYPDFVDSSLTLGDEGIFVIPARWYAGGKYLDDFRSRMLTSRNIKRIVDFNDARKVFPTVDIAGGVCFIHVAKSHNGLCSYTDVHGTTTEIDTAQFDIFVRDLTGRQIITKVLERSRKFMNSTVLPRKPFGLATNFKNFQEYGTDCYTRDGWKKVDPNDITDRHNILDLHKVIMSYASAEHANQPGKDGKRKVVSVCRTIDAGAACLETYLVCFSSPSMEEVEYCKSYLWTKFARFLLNLRLVSQHIGADRFLWVPKMDFTRLWTDEQLYEYFDLTIAQREYIEATIRG